MSFATSYINFLHCQGQPVLSKYGKPVVPNNTPVTPVVAPPVPAAPTPATTA